MDQEPIVYIVDDDSSVRNSLCWLLESAGYRSLSFASAQEFLDNYSPQGPGCLLLDVRMPGTSGLQLQTMLDTQKVTVPIIFISGHVDVRLASEAFRAGACDVLTKPVDSELLFRRIEEALAKDKQLCQTAIGAELKQRQLENLTPKEHEIFQELLKGRTIKQLAAQFNVTFQTTAKHRSRVLSKLNISSDAQLIREFQDFVAS